MPGRDGVQKTSADPFPGGPDLCERYRSVFEGYPGQVAILDRAGRIVEVNAGWRLFALENGLGEACRFEGTDYFAVCREAEGPDAGEAMRATQGIRDVLAGRIPAFSLEYPCHSPHNKRWFLLMVTPLVHREDIAGAIVAHLPITDRKLAELALVQSEKRLNQAQRLVRVGSFERDLATGRGYWSNELFRLTGLVPGTHSPPFADFLQAVHPEDREQVAGVIARVRRQTEPEEFDFRIISPEGGVRHLAATIALERDEQGRPVSYHGAMVDVTRLKDVEASLARLAATDELTGIHNRRRFLELLRAEMGRCDRYGRHVSLAMLDIDNFKRINDTYGHGVGDEVLRRLTAVIGRTLRASDVFGRIGGEEFAVILAESEPDMAFAACERLVRAVARAGAATSAGVLPLTISVGLATAFSEKTAGADTAANRLGCACGMDADTLMRLADRALYRAKAEGKNRVSRFERSPDHAPETPGLPHAAADGARRDGSGGGVAGLDATDGERT